MTTLNCGRTKKNHNISWIFLEKQNNHDMVDADFRHPCQGCLVHKT